MFPPVTRHGVMPIFQAGHEGFVPFARSDPKPRSGHVRWEPKPCPGQHHQPLTTDSDSDKLVAEIDHHSQSTTNRVRVAPQDIHAHDLTPLDLRHAPDTDAHRRSNVSLSQTPALTRLRKPVRLQLRQQTLLEPLNLNAVISIIDFVVQVFPAHHRPPSSRLPIARRCSAYNCSARGIALRYQPRQSPALSPATSKTICCHGSKTNKIRISLRPADPGLSSFMFLIFEAAISPTSGRFSPGPCCLSSSTAAPTWRAESRSSFRSSRAQAANSPVTSTVHATRSSIAITKVLGKPSYRAWSTQLASQDGTRSGVGPPSLRRVRCDTDQQGDGSNRLPCASCHICATRNGDQRSATVTHGHSLVADQRRVSAAHPAVRATDLPSWSCGFASRRPLPPKTPGQPPGYPPCELLS